MSPQQAALVFMQFGVSTSELATPATLKAARNRLLMDKHSDLNGGNCDADAGLINAAYDVLKRLPNGYAEASEAAAVLTPAARAPLPSNFYDRTVPGAFSGAGRPRRAVAPVPLREANMMGRRATDHGGRPGEEYLLYYYDGVLRPAACLLGSTDLFADMARTVISQYARARGFGHRCVFVERRRTGELLLVNLDGRDLPRPIAFGYDSLAGNPCNDRQFLKMLPARLGAIAKGETAVA
jgi:hypothetical protein